VSNRLFSAGLLAATVLLVSGCATPGEPTMSGTPTQTATPTQTFAAMTPAEAKASYKKIAKAGCDAAQELGAVESSKAATVVMTPKSEGYKDYSAAYFASPDTYEIIWELDGLYACGDWFNFSMSEEAGVEAAIDVTFDEKTGKYSTSQTFDGETYAYVSTVTDGKVSSVYSSVTKNDTAIKYGNLTAEDLLILTTAVDRYLAKNG
jgi:hypothetical protein